MSNYPYCGRESNDLMYKIIKKTSLDSLGLPIGVQVIGKPFQEEMVLGVMKEIENLRNTSELFTPLE